MIHITSFLHSTELYDLIRRWMYADVHDDDAGLITRLVQFNTAFMSRYLDRFSHDIFSQLHACQELRTRTARVKAVLKDAIVVNPPYTNARIEQLVSDYRAFPERYYRETPFLGQLYFVPLGDAELYVGSNRIKRVRRLAEKSARRIIDRIFLTIKKAAEALAEDRARRLGIPRQQLITQPADMIEEFLKAERRLLDDLRHRRPLATNNDLVINDVAGAKVILNDGEHQRVLDVLSATGRCELVEIEPHTGRYNATNVIVRYRPPKQELLHQPLSAELVRRMEQRGLPAGRVDAEFAEFVCSGEDFVHIEVIIANYQEMMESEIGRCMHEDRIIEQRLRQEYRAHLAKNVEYLLEYIFAFAASPTMTIDDLPIKLWNRYLPDYYDEVVKQLFHIPPFHPVE